MGPWKRVSDLNWICTYINNITYVLSKYVRKKKIKRGELSIDITVSEAWVHVWLALMFVHGECKFILAEGQAKGSYSFWHCWSTGWPLSCAGRNINYFFPNGLLTLLVGQSILMLVIPLSIFSVISWKDTPKHMTIYAHF